MLIRLTRSLPIRPRQPFTPRLELLEDRVQPTASVLDCVEPPPSEEMAVAETEFAAPVAEEAVIWDSTAAASAAEDSAPTAAAALVAEPVATAEPTDNSSSTPVSTEECVTEPLATDEVTDHSASLPGSDPGLITDPGTDSHAGTSSDPGIVASPALIVEPDPHGSDPIFSSPPDDPHGEDDPPIVEPGPDGFDPEPPIVDGSEIVRTEQGVGLTRDGNLFALDPLTGLPTRLLGESIGDFRALSQGDRTLLFAVDGDGLLAVLFGDAAQGFLELSSLMGPMNPTALEVIDRGAGLFEVYLTVPGEGRPVVLLLDLRAELLPEGGAFALVASLLTDLTGLASARRAPGDTAEGNNPLGGGTAEPGAENATVTGPGRQALEQVERAGAPAGNETIPEPQSLEQFNLGVEEALARLGGAPRVTLPSEAEVWRWAQHVQEAATGAWQGFSNWFGSLAAPAELPGEPAPPEMEDADEGELLVAESAWHLKDTQEQPWLGAALVAAAFASGAWEVDGRRPTTFGGRRKSRRGR